MDLGGRTMISLSSFCILFFIIVASDANHIHKKLYIIHLGSTQNTAEITHHQNRALLLQILTSEEEVDNSMLYSYKHGFRGFAAMLTTHEAAAISRMDEVVSVHQNRMHKVHTTQSWNFLSGTPQQENQVEPLDASQDVIIGMIDSGIWPESKSFHDQGMGHIPKRFKGECVPGERFTIYDCNKKIIGARYYLKGIEAEQPLNKSGKTFFRSARDQDGHGTHTASTAAGRFVQGASFPGGIAKGTARGGAPLSRLAIYKVCWFTNCADADLLAAFDDAIHDGVDIISVSIGSGPDDYLTDVISIGSFHAMRHGILVTCSVGNTGRPGSAANVAPWILSVAASSIDRDLPTNLLLGNNLTIKGRASNPDTSPWSKLVLAKDIPAPGVGTNSSFCMNNTLDASKVVGNIIVCKQLNILDSRPLKSLVIKDLGGAGMVLVDEITKDITFNYFLPATNVGAREGFAIENYVQSTSNPVATILPTTTVTGFKPAPSMAVFSSRGPNAITPDILKPDITAPGVSILAAWSPAETDITGGRVLDYNILTGTSMSCPHVAGIAASLKARYPKWSPAAIKSAIITTATTLNNNGSSIMNEVFGTVAGPFDYGGGHVRPDKSLNPGLIYDADFNDYVSFLCGIGKKELRNVTNDSTPCPSHITAPYNLNYPSISISNLKGKLAVMRSVTNVGDKCEYEATVVAPAGLKVTVIPDKLSFHHLNQKKNFIIEFQVLQVQKDGNFVFGSLTWSDGIHFVTSPIAVNATSL